MPAGVPDLYADVSRSRFAARAHPAHARVGRGGDRANAIGAQAFGPVPGLPRVRDRLPERRGLSRADRGDAREAEPRCADHAAGAVGAMDVLSCVHLSDAIEDRAASCAIDAEDRALLADAEDAIVRHPAPAVAEDGAVAAGGWEDLAQAIA